MTHVKKNRKQSFCTDYTIIFLFILSLILTMPINAFASESTLKFSSPSSSPYQQVWSKEVSDAQWDSIGNVGSPDNNIGILNLSIQQRKAEIKEKELINKSIFDFQSENNSVENKKSFINENNEEIMSPINNLVPPITKAVGAMGLISMAYTMYRGRKEEVEELLQTEVVSTKEVEIILNKLNDLSFYNDENEKNKNDSYEDSLIKELMSILASKTQEIDQHIINKNQKNESLALIEETRNYLLNSNAAMYLKSTDQKIEEYRIKENELQNKMNPITKSEQELRSEIEIMELDYKRRDELINEYQPQVSKYQQKIQQFESEYKKYEPEYLKYKKLCNIEENKLKDFESKYAKEVEKINEINKTIKESESEIRYLNTRDAQIKYGYNKSYDMKYKYYNIINQANQQKTQLKEIEDKYNYIINDKKEFLNELGNYEAKYLDAKKQYDSNKEKLKNYQTMYQNYMDSYQSLTKKLPQRKQDLIEYEKLASKLYDITKEKEEYFSPRAHTVTFIRSSISELNSKMAEWETKINTGSIDLVNLKSELDKGICNVKAAIASEQKNIDKYYADKKENENQSFIAKATEKVLDLLKTSIENTKNSSQSLPITTSVSIQSSVQGNPTVQVNLLDLSATASMQYYKVEIDKLEIDLSNYKKEADKYRNKTKNATSLDSINTKIQTIENNLKIYKNKIDEYIALKTNCESSLKTVESQISTYEKLLDKRTFGTLKYQSTSEKLAEYNKEAVSYKDQIKKYEEYIVKYQEKRDESITERGELIFERKNLPEYIAECERNVIEYDKKIEEKNKQISEFKEKIEQAKALDTANNKLISKNQGLKGNILDINAKKEDESSQIQASLITGSVLSQTSYKPIIESEGVFVASNNNSYVPKYPDTELSEYKKESVFQRLKNIFYGKEIVFGYEIYDKNELIWYEKVSLGLMPNNLSGENLRKYEQFLSSKRLYQIDLSNSTGLIWKLFETDEQKDQINYLLNYQNILSLNDLKEFTDDEIFEQVITLKEFYNEQINMIGIGATEPLAKIGGTKYFKETSGVFSKKFNQIWGKIKKLSNTQKGKIITKWTAATFKNIRTIIKDAPLWPKDYFERFKNILFAGKNPEFQGQKINEIPMYKDPNAFDIPYAIKDGITKPGFYRINENINEMDELLTKYKELSRKYDFDKLKKAKNMFKNGEITEESIGEITIAIKQNGEIVMSPRRNMIMNEAGEWIIGPRYSDYIPHPMLTEGEKAPFFGTIKPEFDEAGKLKHFILSNDSGHTKPGDESLDIAKRVFNELGYDVVLKKHNK